MSTYVFLYISVRMRTEISKSLRAISEHREEDSSLSRVVSSSHFFLTVRNQG